MPRSEVEISNAALRMLGVSSRITSFDDGSKHATICRDAFPEARDETLELHEWKCATVHSSLARLEAAPDNPNYSYQFQLPADLLRLIERSDSTVAWVVEQDRLLTDSTSCTIKYIKQQIDPSRFSSLLAKTIAARLAADISFSVTKDPTVEGKMELRFGAYLQEARFQDNRGKQSKEETPALWIDAQDLA